MTSAALRPSTQGPPVDGHDPGLCGNCGHELDLDYRHQPVPHRCCTCRDTGRVRVTADRTRPAFGQQQPCPDCRFRPQRITETETAAAAGQRLSMGLEPAYTRVRLDDFDQRRDRAAYMTAAAYVAKWPPVPAMLTFASETPGNGKTTLACAILNEIAIRHGQYGLFRSWPDLLAEMRATQRPNAPRSLEELTEPIERAPIVVLDDVGVGRATDFNDEQLYLEINRRYARGLPLVVTTNTWSNLDGRLQSRLSDRSKGRIVIFEAPDARPALPAPKEANGG